MAVAMAMSMAMAMATARLPPPQVLPMLLLIASFLPCGNTNDDILKKTGGATASMFFFLLPRVAEESARAVGKSGGELPFSETVDSTTRMGVTITRSMVAQAASLYNESKEVMSCLYNETKQAVACLYNETVQAVAAFLSNESGEMVAKACPSSCFRPNPVCGKDGVTYWCGASDAACAGAEVEHEGFCDVVADGETGGRGAVAVQSLLLVHMIWLMLAGFLVLLGVP
ncbi:hypothetical protein KP509_17G074600 [Ceratopteris richardii]|uniref:Uncharacterized protein n=1 Tax=Ceratopteris richardii TaxID=49495 RepID=A0A8T2SZF6_CERRI|nr:hypothetical protein KP509_17G074600 [Ceratopteris richardii]